MGIATLEQAEIDFYHENGYYLVQKQLFSEDKLNRLTHIFEEHLQEKGTKLSDELDTPHLRDGRLYEFLLSKEVLDLVETIIGPNIGLFSSHFICKDPYVGRRTPWHTDRAYWEKVIDRFDKIVTVWLAIDRSNKENGCMGVIPRSHKNVPAEHGDVGGYLNLEIRNIDKSDAVYFELERGECSLHDSRIIHGADANASPFRRCGYTMRYFSTEAKIFQEGQFFLARGADLANSKLLNREEAK